MKLLTFDEITPEDILWLTRALAFDYHETSLEEILDGVRDGTKQLWRMESGIVVSAMFDWTGGRELVVSHIAGKNFIPNMVETASILRAYAKANGCRWWMVLASRPGLYKAYAKIGKESGRIFIEEI